MKPSNFINAEEALNDLTALLQEIQPLLPLLTTKDKHRYTRLSQNTNRQAIDAASEVKDEASNDAYLTLLNANKIELYTAIVVFFNPSFVITEQNSDLILRTIAHYSEIENGKLAREALTDFPHLKGKALLALSLIHCNDFTHHKAENYHNNPLYVMIYYNMDIELISLLLSKGLKASLTHFKKSAKLALIRCNVEAAFILLSQNPSLVSELKSEFSGIFTTVHELTPTSSYPTDEVYRNAGRHPHANIAVVRKTFIKTLAKLEEKNPVFEYSKDEKQTLLSLIRAELKRTHSIEECNEIYLRYIQSHCLNYRDYSISSYFKDYSASKTELIHMVQYRVVAILGMQWVRNEIDEATYAEAESISHLEVFSQNHIDKGVDPKNTKALQDILKNHKNTSGCVELFDSQLATNGTHFHILKKDESASSSQHSTSLERLVTALAEAKPDDALIEFLSTQDIDNDLDSTIMKYTLAHCDLFTCSLLISANPIWLDRIRRELHDSYEDNVDFPYIVPEQSETLSQPELGDTAYKLLKVMQLLEQKDSLFEYTQLERQIIVNYAFRHADHATSVEACFTIYDEARALKCMTGDENESFGKHHLISTVRRKIYSLCTNAVRNKNLSNTEKCNLLYQCLAHEISTTGMNIDVDYYQREMNRMLNKLNTAEQKEAPQAQETNQTSQVTVANPLPEVQSNTDLSSYFGGILSFFSARTPTSPPPALAVTPPPQQEFEMKEFKYESPPTP